MALTQVSDIVVPEIFDPYIQQLTEVKSRLVQSGALVLDAKLSQDLNGGGLTFNMPSYRDLDDTLDNVSTDSVSDTIAADFNAGTPNPRLDATPVKTTADQEIAVRLSRNQHWSSADLTGSLAGNDPLDSIMSRVSDYWARRMQDIFIATWGGVIKDNVANDSGDYENDISGSSFNDGVTNFSAEAFLDALVTMGDSSDNLSLVMVHSVVLNRMKKQNLIDFIPDARGEVRIPMFMGHQVIQDDRMPVASNVYDTWIFGAGATRLGVGSAKRPSEVHREPLAGNGGGEEILSSRVEWSQHPVGHAYTGSAANGGPGNGTGANNLNNSGSWNRVFPERNQIPFARLLTREA